MNKVHRKELLSVFGLLGAALLWGISFPAMKSVVDLPIFFIMAIRFSVASLALAIVFHRLFRHCNRQILKYALLLSFCIFFCIYFCTIGIKYTTSARASFFSCLSFMMVPFLNYLIYKVKFCRNTLTSVLICLAGVFLLSYTGEIGGFRLNAGDLLCIMGSLTGSFHIVFLERVMKKERMDPILFTLFMMFFIAVWSTLTAFFTGSFTGVSPAPFQLGTIIFIGLFCTAAAFLLQSVSQRYVPSNRVGIILALEPASGCIFSVLLLGDVLSVYGWAGAALVMGSMLFLEIASSRSLQKNPTIAQ